MREALTFEGVSHAGYAQIARRANLPHPDGYCSEPQIRPIIRASRTHKEGRFAVVTDVGSGMRWTRELRKTNASVTRTEKSCGSGAPTLALSLADLFAR